MKFTKLKIGNETQCILTEKIGRWSVTSHHCDACGMTHYVLEVYDLNGCILCSMNGTKDQIDGLSCQISEDIKSLSQKDLSGGNQK